MKPEDTINKYNADLESLNSEEDFGTLEGPSEIVNP